MTLRDTTLIALRPHVATEIAKNPAEQFQNQVLRPILKFQHERIVALFQNHLLKRKVNLTGVSVDDRKSYVEKAFQKDIPLRNQMVGIVVGFLTAEEWSTFIESERELSRRLQNLLVQRIQSTLK